MKTLLISDLHLDPKRPDIQHCFDQFISSCLNNKNNEIDSLYILGDLFEVWLGDDASIPLYQHTIEQLKQLTDSGINVFVMHGNRDFLMGSAFEQASGCKLIPDPYLLKLPQKREPGILLSHGDIFCTDDIDYLKFREMVREPLWQQEFLSKPVAERVQTAQAMRAQSKLHGQEKQAKIMDVNQQSVEAMMSEQGVNTLIHGHTHRPANHEFMLNNRTVKRIVLPDWTPDAQVFELVHSE